MKVGDLVRHQMYSELKKPALVVAVDDHGDDSIWIKLFDPEIGFLGTWDKSTHYEVVSESR